MAKLTKEEKEYKEAIAALWRMGELSWKLKKSQKDVYDFIKGKKDKYLVINATRRFGKTYVLLILAAELAIQKPRSIIKFTQPKQNMIRKNVLPNWEDLIADCPKELKPKFNKQDNVIEFPNGSQIQIAGTDGGNADNLRGANAAMAIIDEAGFSDNLGYVINSVIAPSTTLTRGQIIIASSTPLDSTHEFITNFLEPAALENRLIIKTFKDAINDSIHDDIPLVTPEMWDEEVKKYVNGEKHESFRTEYMCEIIRSDGNMVIPEFNDETEAACVRKWPIRPEYCDKYVAMDVGFRDLTFVLFAYYNYHDGLIIIEDELVIKGDLLTTEMLAESIKIKEKTLWYNRKTASIDKPTLRVSDNNLNLIRDLQSLYELQFIPTQKTNKDAEIAFLRDMILEQRIIIDPVCVNLVAHLKNATWDAKRKDYNRHIAYGHFDGVDALLYLVRNINRQKNPYPKDYKYQGLGDDWFINPKLNPDKRSADQLAKNFKLPTSMYRKKQD